MTYTSVVMNPVSSDRKWKRMKRQQQMETVGNMESVLRVQDASGRRLVLHAPTTTGTERCLEDPAYTQGEGTFPETIKALSYS